jgi:hypothetical protein
VEFSSDVEMQKIQDLAQEFYEHILYNEPPLFVSDEATIWSISAEEAEELLKRCADFYGKTLTVADLKQPLWKLIRQVNEGRVARP